MLIDSVPAILLVTVIGTTAPFSAISGAFSAYHRFSGMRHRQERFKAAVESVASKAALGHAANTARGVIRPALLLRQMRQQLQSS